MQTHATYERDLTFHKLFIALGAFLGRVGCVVLLHTRPMYVYMDPPGELINIPPGPDLVEHNVLHVGEHHITEKGPHDIMTNINIIFHSFVT